MRSTKMRRSRIGEDAFEDELKALHHGLQFAPYRMSGDHISTRMELLLVAERYVDELNKVRKYACPLSTNMLLSSILEAVLLVLILEHSVQSAKTRIWIRAAEEAALGRRKYSKPEIPTLTLSEIIQIADDLKLLRTSGVQQKVDLLLLRDLLPTSLREHISTSSWDAKRNHEIMHNLRSVRNAVHPMEMISKDAGRDYDEFAVAIWMGLRVLLLLNTMLGIKSALQTGE